MLACTQVQRLSVAGAALLIERPCSRAAIAAVATQPLSACEPIAHLNNATLHHCDFPSYEAQ